MSRPLLALTGLLVLLAAPLLIQGCSDDNPTEPLPPTRAVITSPESGQVLPADELVQLEGEGIMSTGQPIYPNRLEWYLGSGSDTTFIATGFDPLVALADTVADGPTEYTVTLLARESINLSGSKSVTFFVEAPENWDPEATVVEPLDGEDFLPAHVLTVFDGLATDVEDGDLTGDAVVWTSDIQGTLGTGTSIEASLLPGEHLIILTATDSGGQTDADTISVTARQHTSGQVTGGEFFFRASDFTELCPDKEIVQLIGDGALTVDTGAGTASLSIAELAGSISCATADVCELAGEWTTGNARVTATGDLAGGGTLTLEISLFVENRNLNIFAGLLRGVETPASGPPCVYRSYVRFTGKTD